MPGSQRHMAGTQQWARTRTSKTRELRGYALNGARMGGTGADGRLLNKHRKVMPTMGERVWWGKGDGGSLRAVDTAAGRIGALICWEHWMPLTRAALHASSEDVHVAAWPRVST